MTGTSVLEVPVFCNFQLPRSWVFRPRRRPRIHSSCALSSISFSSFFFNLPIPIIKTSNAKSITITAVNTDNKRIICTNLFLSFPFVFSSDMSDFFPSLAKITRIFSWAYNSRQSTIVEINDRYSAPYTIIVPKFRFNIFCLYLICHFYEKNSKFAVTPSYRRLSSYFT